ncbi:hydroxymethylglutaryl-CoA synthase [Microbacterium sp. GXF6406]
MNRSIGIHDIEIGTTHHVVDLADLAVARGVDPDKFRIGLGQDQMSFPAPDEDIVTMGAAAARALLARTGADGVRTLLFATESGIDQSKSAAVFAHGLLGLGADVRAVELKQACYAGTAALQMALGIVARNPAERVLIIAADVARYALDSAGEPTQGAASVAMLVSADPALLEIDPVSGVFTADVDDFWRPNDSSTALVDGKLSMSAYIDALLGAWDDLQARGGVTAADIAAFAYHQPFTKMAAKAQRRLAAHLGAELADDDLVAMSTYNRRLGNSYTASLYVALAALIDARADLDGRRVGLFSYGSGSVGELLTARVLPQGGREDRSARVSRMLDARAPLPIAEYERLHALSYPSGTDTETPRTTTGPFRFAGIRGGARQYEHIG